MVKFSDNDGIFIPKETKDMATVLDRLSLSEGDRITIKDGLNALTDSMYGFGLISGIALGCLAMYLLLH
jgi:hypothetical protein